MKFQLCLWELPIFIYKLMCQCSLLNSVSFLFCEFIRVTSWNNGKTVILVRSSFKFQIEILVSYSKSSYVNENMSFPNNKFEGNFSTYVFGKSFWHYRHLKSECWTSRHIYEAYILTISLVQTCSLETTTFCLCTRLRVYIFKVNQCQCKHVFS